MACSVLPGVDFHLVVFTSTVVQVKFQALKPSLGVQQSALQHCCVPHICRAGVEMHEEAGICCGHRSAMERQQSSGIRLLSLVLAGFPPCMDAVAWFGPEFTHGK